MKLRSEHAGGLRHPLGGDWALRVPSGGESHQRVAADAGQHKAPLRDRVRDSRRVLLCLRRDDLASEQTHDSELSLAGERRWRRRRWEDDGMSDAPEALSEVQSEYSLGHGSRRPAELTFTSSAV
jgi:hypothetical protein